MDRAELEAKFEAEARLAGFPGWVGADVTLQDGSEGFLRLSVDSSTLQFRSEDGDFLLEQVVLEGPTFSRPILRVTETIFGLARTYDLIQGRRRVLQPDGRPGTKFQEMVADAFIQKQAGFNRRLEELRELRRI